MELTDGKFYRALAPRLCVLVTTRDKDGNSNAAPFSFVMPVSVKPPLVAIASAHKRDTLENIRETKNFVLNVAPAEIVEQLWKCSEALPRGVSEIKEAGLTEVASKMVKSPRIGECVAWYECELEWEKEAGDHIVVIGRVVKAEVKDEFFTEGHLDVVGAEPLMHVSGKSFMVAGKEVTAS